jgi:hypothetical protein
MGITTGAPDSTSSNGQFIAPLTAIGTREAGIDPIDTSQRPNLATDLRAMLAASDEVTFSAKIRYTDPELQRFIDAAATDDSVKR